MTYKIPDLPSAKAYKEELADFWEYQALCNPKRFISSTEIAQTLAKELDEIKHEGIESEDDELDAKLSDVFAELQRRQLFTSDKYPFTFTKYSITLNEETSLTKNVYLFLLLCTRFDMARNRVHNGVDGALLFEKLCAVIASNYFGENSSSYVFGTANPSNFANKVSNLINKIGEGKHFTNPNNNNPTKNDDAVDVVVWKNFTDKRIGKLIAFGQCKTGTHWRDEIHKLKPSDFCDNWFLESPILHPLPLIFICDTLNEDYNFHTAQKGFLFFNRFRILEYVKDNLNIEIQNKIQSWLNGALNSITINE